jgi:hypothetical protein
MAYIDEQGNEWERIESDPVCWKRADGLCVYSTTEHTFASVCEMIYNPTPPPKTDAERIAELEAQLAALLSRL